MKSAIQKNLLLLFAMTPAVGTGQSVVAGDAIGELSGVVVSLMIVVGVILVSAWILRRTPLAAATRKTGPLKLVATLPLGPKERLLLVEADGCEVLIGVSPAGIFPLHRYASGVVSEEGTVAEPHDPPDSFTRSMKAAMWLKDAS